MGKIRALALVSGGLDSALAVKLVQEQGVEVVGIFFVDPFSKYERESAPNSPAGKIACQLGIELVIEEQGEEFLEIVKKPRYGYGRSANPCIDCRILRLRRAGKLLRELSAQFIITGEVVGQRPMSQRREIIKLIDKETGLGKIILRPLSARILNPTLAEEKGWVDREKLLGLIGRSRKVQLHLAKKYGLEGFSSPAGGCLLTEKEFGRKVFDLIQHQPDFGLNDVKLLRLGRHFRLSPQAKLVVGKNDRENKKIISLALPGDILIHTDGVPGPTGLVRGEITEQDLKLAQRILAYYVHKSPAPQVPMILVEKTEQEEKIRSSLADKIDRQILEEKRI